MDFAVKIHVREHLPPSRSTSFSLDLIFLLVKIIKLEKVVDRLMVVGVHSPPCPGSTVNEIGLNFL